MATSTANSNSAKRFSTPSRIFRPSHVENRGYDIVKKSEWEFSVRGSYWQDYTYLRNDVGLDEDEVIWTLGVGLKLSLVC
jgi:hypothetical protein